MLTDFKFDVSKENILSVSSKISMIDASSLSQKPGRLHHSRNPSNRGRSGAEQQPDHAGEQYRIEVDSLDTTTKQASAGQ